MSEDSHAELDAERAFSSALQAQLSRCDSERIAFRTQLTEARFALARIRNVATAAHAPLAQCLDWCANEAVFTLDRLAAHAPPSRTGLPWSLTCGCSADANDNRTWCPKHGGDAHGNFTFPDGPPASEAAGLRSQLADARADIDRLAALVLEVRAERQQARAALEAARPSLKHAAVDGSPDAAAALDLVAHALAS